MQKIRPMPTKLRIAIAIGLCSLSAACAAQITVGPTGTYPTIQQGVNAANAGDTVIVQPGTYPENVTISLPITLEAQACVGQTASSGCNSQTTIDGGLNGTVITVNNIPSLKTVIEGFTIINGFSNVYAGNSAGIDLEYSGAQIINNSFSANGAALYVNSGAVTFTNNTVSTVTQNGPTCSSDNGLYLSGTNTTVLYNSGGIAATGISNNTISGGKCFGGVGINDEQGTNTTIQFNTISGQFQAIIVGSTSAFTYIFDNLITGNSSGGVYIDHETNSPPADPADTFLVNNTFVNNLSSARGLTGNAGPAEVSVSGTYSKVALINNILSTNSNTNPLLDCAGNPPSSSNVVTPIILDHNLFYNSGTYSKLGTNGCPITTGTFGNQNANPGFVSTTNFQLASGSPAIDAGNNSYLGGIYAFSSDITGNNSRILNGVVDIGAYESSASLNAFSDIVASSSSYYLLSGNTFTVSAQFFSNGSTPVAGQSLTFTSSNGVTPVTVTTDANGKASVPFTIATPGIYPFTVSYAGGTYPAVTSVVLYVYVTSPLAVTTIGLTSNINPSLVGQNVTFTVTSNATDGTHPSPIVLADNGTTLATLTTTSGTATYSTATLAQGSHPMTATFAGDSAHTNGVASLTQLVGVYTPTTTTLSSSVNPSVFGQSVTITAHVASASGVPTGSVVFLDGATQLGAAVPVTAGIATYTTTAFTVGSHSLTANFTATGSYANSSGTLTQVVNGDPTQAVLTVAPTTATYGTNVTLTATISVVAPYTGTPTGNVTFLDGATVIGTAPVTGGIATFTSGTFSVGTHAFGCTYGGGGNFAGSTCNVVPTTITQAATSTTVNSSVNPSPALTPITFTVKPTSSGQSLATGATVTLGITPVGGTTTNYTLTTDATGTASYTIPGLATGTYTVTGSYPATTNYSSSSGTLTEVVNINATTITLGATPNPGLQNNPVALTATVTASAGTAAPTGSVTFLDGATPLGTVTLTTGTGTTSTAVLTTSALTTGVHTISASYAPSVPSFSVSGPATLSLTINPQDFTFTATPPSISIQTEHHGTLPLSLTAIGGFPGAISISCGTLPQYVTCELNPTTVTLNPSGSASIVNLTLDTDALLNFTQARQHQLPCDRRGRLSLPACFRCCCSEPLAAAVCAEYCCRCCFWPPPRSRSLPAVASIPATRHPALTPSP